MKDTNDSSGTGPNDPELDADVARLLGSFEGEAPPPGAASKLLALVDSFESSDEGAPSSASSWTKLKTVAAVGGLLVTAGLCLVAVRHETSKTVDSIDEARPTAIPVTSPRSESALPAPVEPAAAEPSIPVMAASALPSAGPSPRSSSNSSSSAAESKDSFREQLAIVESARHSLSEKRTDECLETLRRYDAKYPSGLFTTEVQVVRVEALLASGQSEKAFALARKVIAENPRGPYADRLRALLPKADGLDR